MYQGGNQRFASPEEALAHISEQAWSNYTRADYTLEQWHAACLVHTHDGAPTAKSQCKLPVKTPNGALNRNGVHAAAAALAGARGGLKGVSADQKQKAASALKRYYSQLQETPPDSLSHHGVKGMKWGVRKEYKLIGRDSSGQKVTIRDIQSQVQSALSDRKRRRVEKFLTRADVMGTGVSELKLKNEALRGTRNPAKLYAKQVNKTDIKNLERSQKRALRDAEAVKKGKLTSTQKKVIVGAVAVSAVLAAGAVYRGQQSGALNSALLRSAALLKGEKTPFKVDKNLSAHMSASEILEKVAKPVNPGYSKAGGKMNCRRSTYAYELRRRGFDVHATTSASGWGQSESGVINAITPGSHKFYSSMSMSSAVVGTGKSSVAKGDTRFNPLTKVLVEGLHDPMRPIRESSSQKVLEALANQPNGSRGEVLFKFPGFGHSMAYEIVDGVPQIFDSQKGVLYNASKLVEEKWDGFTGAEITRLDNVDLDLNFLSRWATNVGS